MTAWLARSNTFQKKFILCRLGMLFRVVLLPAMLIQSPLKLYKNKTLRLGASKSLAIIFFRN